MKGLKEKKGFTLIELLAVIVVLAIVMVLAATTVLPLMQKTQKNAFASEATAAMESASQAVTLLGISQYDGAYSTYSGADDDYTYCFTVAELKAAGLWDKTDSTDYAGVVLVAKSGDNYNYTVTMHNADWAVSAVEGTVAESDVSEYVAPAAGADDPYACATYGTVAP